MTNVERIILDIYKKITNSLDILTNWNDSDRCKVVEALDATATFALSADDSAALEASSISKASAGKLFGGLVFNSSGSDVYFQIHNTTTVPADTAVPAMFILVPANSQVPFDFPKGKYFSTGITWCGSSTYATKTITGSVLWVNIQYI